LRSQYEGVDWRPPYHADGDAIDATGGGVPPVNYYYDQDHPEMPAAMTHGVTGGNVFDLTSLPRTVLIPGAREKQGGATDTPAVDGVITNELFSASRAKGGGQGTNWLLLLLLAAGIGVAVWYFGGGQKRR